MFRARTDGDWYWWNIGGWNNTRHAIEKAAGGAKTILGAEVPGHVETGRWYDVRIELPGPRIRRHLDGKLIHDVEDRGAVPEDREHLPHGARSASAPGRGGLAPFRRPGDGPHLRSPGG